MDRSQAAASHDIGGVRLLRTKLFIPRPHPDLVPRGRLLDRLDAGRGCPLTLVTSPAGFGKTTLIGEWLMRCEQEAGRQGRPAACQAWVSLDAGDNEPVRFWSYFVAALQSALGPHAGEAAAQLLAGPRPAPAEIVLTELINELAGLAGPCTLVLDDYHAITNDEIHRGLDFLLANPPAALRLLIATRHTPPLALPVLRARRKLAELGPDDLRFTQEEAAAFLSRVTGLRLTPDQVRVLEERTEGWAAGLQLAALSMQGVKDVSRFVRAFSGEQRFVFDYLAQEVLARQDPDVAAFLLQTAVLDRMSGALCDATLGRTDGEAMLARLDAANLFVVPLDQERQWYRYHHLFAGFLRARLAKTCAPEDVRNLHARAGRWCREHGLPEEALEHALAAQDYDAAAPLLRVLVEVMFRRSNLLTVIQWFRRLPGDFLAGQPDLAMIYAWALLATLQLEDAERQLEAIEAYTGATTAALADPAANAALSATERAALVEVAAMRSNIAIHRFDLPTTLRLGQLALDHLGQDGGEALYNSPADLRPPILFTLAVARELSGQTDAACATFAEAAAGGGENQHIIFTSLGHLTQLRVLQGRLRDALGTCRQALAGAAGRGGRLTPMAGIARATVGAVLYEWNDLDAAEAEFRAAIEVSRPWHYWEALLPAHAGLARVHRARADWGAAEAELAELEVLSQRLKLPMLLPLVAAARARLACEHGDQQAAAAWAAGCDWAQAPVPYLREAEALVLARVWLAQGRLDAARGLLAELLAGVEAGGRCGRMIEVLALQALLEQAAGRTAPATDTLVRALQMAEPEAYCRLFLDEGPAMAHLLGQVQAPPATAAYARRLLAALATAAAAAPAAQPGQPAAGLAASGEQLSAREIEVLTLLAEGLSNQEIAERLVVSVNTVKTHLKTIYGKLDATTRTQALARARQLGLI